MEESEKPKAKAIGENGNIFVTLGIAAKALKKVGKVREAQDMTMRVWDAGNYDEALVIMMEYVEFE
jgi:hypothetical protein